MTAESQESGPSASGDRDLRTRTARGAKVVLLGQLARIGLQFVAVVVLARLLSPQDYGLFAFAVAIIAMGEVFRDFGLSTAAIQAPSLSRGQRSNLFWMNVGLGLALAVGCVVLAPLAARATGHQETADLTRAMAIVFVLNGALAQYRADLNRHMRFVALTVADVLGTLVGLVAAVLAALAGLGFWALALQQVVGVAAILVFAVVAAGWLPGAPDRTATVRPFLKFGLGMVGTQFVGYGNNYVDTLTIGIRFGTVELGIYNRAYQVLMQTLNQIRNPTMTVALPVLSRLKPGSAEMDEMLVRGQAAVGYTLVALAAFAGGAAVPIIAIVLGPGWSDAAPIFAILSVAGAFSSLGVVSYWVFVSRALTGRLFWLSVASFAIRAACVLIGSHWGVIGVAAGYALAPALILPLSYYALSRWTPLPFAALCRGAARATGCAAVAGGASHAAVSVLSATPDLVQVIGAGVATVAAYALVGLIVPAVRRDLLGVIRFAKASGRFR